MSERTKWLLAGPMLVVIILAGLYGFGLLPPSITCYAGQPTPCKDTEHPQEPPCNMQSCKRQNGEAQCSHYCTKAKGCCFCKKDQCYTGTPNTPEDLRTPDERYHN